MFLTRVHLEPTLVEAYGKVPGGAWLVLDAVLQALEPESDRLLGMELSPASLLVEQVGNDPVVLLLDETRAEVVAEGVRRALSGSPGFGCRTVMRAGSWRSWHRSGVLE
ncbi:hypothetical protein [Methanopyrus kandleri]|uniref:Uncharacterized protein n=1 Tax=Methanopyrus kandleri TaxID=2320 RepID=A0A832TAJ0_9EURY|nr:hypothetical protein [Methanopyrus kandleri]HII70541.1 hypothetical protein [Methanopyrus kandleri]